LSSLVVAQMGALNALGPPTQDLIHSSSMRTDEAILGIKIEYIYPLI